VVESRRQEDDSVEVKPRLDAKLAVNSEILSALRSAGVDPEVEEVLEKFVDETKIESLLKSECFVGIASEVKRSHHKAVLNKKNEKDEHPPPADRGTVAITEDSWCLYIRTKKSNTISNDACELAKAVEHGLMIPATVSEVIQRTSRTSHSFPANPKDALDLVSPLPTSSAQRNINEKLFCEELPVVIVHGPPGK
jgi:hypothetical protein